MTQFRNYSFFSAEFSPHINAITGNNGAGKTNVLEALHYLAMTRGFSRRTEGYSLQEGMPYFTVEGEAVLGNEKKVRIQCSYMPPKGKKMLVNRKPLKKMSDHIGQIPLVVVLPNDTALIHGSPSVRRKFMDAFISQHDRKYLEALLRYEKALDQRNALLSLMHDQGSWNEEHLQMWDDQMAAPGRYLHQARADFLRGFAPIFNKYFQLIVSDQEKPEIQLDSRLGENQDRDWQLLFQESRNKDRYSQRTSVGVHKEDLVFSINGQGVKYFGSQGQQKTFVTALKLTQYELLSQLTGKAPLLLLDDVFDKLDRHRLRAIARILHEDVRGQVFITDTALDRTKSVFSEFDQRNVRYFQVENGVFQPCSG